MNSHSSLCRESSPARQSKPGTSRRQLLKRGSAIASALVLPIARGVLAGSAAAAVTLPASAAASTHSQRSLSFYNIHTRESIQATYWRDGNYLDEKILSISHHMRDHRENETMMVDVQLLDILWAVRQLVDPQMRFDIISAYRTPKTNAMLRKKSDRVAKYSLHMLGKAVDLRGSDQSLEAIKQAGLQLASGGVGYYPDSGFIHIDSGEVRNW